ncbi:MAG TPA: phospholipid carrier-dependent glycosyltransferase [Steroidobacteraceae bacterium]
MSNTSRSSAFASQSVHASFALRSIVLGTLALLGIALWFGNTVYRSLAEPDEGRYAEIPREMVASGDWVTPHLNAIPYFEKPPLQYWATAVAYRAFGFEFWVSRLWATTLGLLGILVTYATGRALWGATAGAFAALVLASSPLYFIVAHINTLDIGLAFFVNAGLSCLLLAQREGLDPGARRRWMGLAWFALGCGFLQKGLVAIALPGLTVLVYSLIHRNTHLWRRLYLLDGVAILALTGLPWVVLVASRNPDFLQFFFVHEHLERFATTVHHRSEPWWYFIVILGVGVLPWITTIARSAFSELRASRSASELQPASLLLIFSLTQLVFFSMSGSKLAPYIVSAVSPLALLAGRWLQACADVRALRPVAIVAAAFSVLLLCLGPLLPHFMEPSPKLTAYVQIAHWARIAGAVGLVSVGLTVAAGLRRQLSLGVAALAVGFVIALSVLMCGSDALESLRARPGIAALIAPHLAADTPFYCVGMYWQSLPFALQRTCTLVQHTGEIETRFDRTQSHSLSHVADFIAQWRREPSAVAIVSPVLWQEVVASGIKPRVILQEANVVVIVKP